MSSSKDDGVDLVISKSKPKLTPPGYEIQLSTEQAILIAEFVDSPVFKVLKSVYAAQRKDHIARGGLNSAQTVEQLFYFKGMAAELVRFFKNLEGVKKALNGDDKEAEQAKK